MIITKRLEELIKQLQQNIYEKEEIFNLSILAMLSGESIFLLGKLGIAKTLISRRLKYAFKNIVIFEYLINDYSTLEEIFGPISIEDSQKGIYKRLIDKYLPTAEIIFLDEIWKSVSSIRNFLLTIINEKIFHNAGLDIKVPLKLLISTSNELPKKNKDFESLYDCFIIRYIVHPLKDENNFNDMISSTNELDIKVDDFLQITHDEYYIWIKKINNIKITQTTFDFISNFKKKLYIETEGKYYISDRRWKKIAYLMKASAFYNGRDFVDKADWLIINHCIWNDEKEEKSFCNIFNEFYLNYLLIDIYRKKDCLNKKIKELLIQYENIKKNNNYKIEYLNIFNGKLKGKFNRIFWENKNFPICFIKKQNFIYICNNKNKLRLVKLYYGKNLENITGVLKTKIIYVNDNSFKIIKTNEKIEIEIENLKNNDNLKLEKKILDIENDINILETDFYNEKEKLLSLNCIFFKKQFIFAVKNAFSDDKLNFNEDLLKLNNF